MVAPMRLPVEFETKEPIAGTSTYHLALEMMVHFLLVGENISINTEE